MGFLSCGTKRARYSMISKWVLLEGQLVSRMAVLLNNYLALLAPEDLPVPMRAVTLPVIFEHFYIHTGVPVLPI